MGFPVGPVHENRTFQDLGLGVLTMVPNRRQSYRLTRESDCPRSPPVLPCCRFFERTLMTKIKSSALVLVCAVSLASCLLLAQVQRPGEYARGEKPSPMMNFFVTSEPIGDGGKLGGLVGADAHCQALATSVGAENRTWHAF